MRIDITGYVTETHGKDGFTIKVTCDAVQCLSFRNIQISREVRVFIHSRYPWETNNVFQEISMSQWDDPRNREIAESRSLSNCTAIGNLDHSLNQDCDTIPIYLKGASDGEASSFSFRQWIAIRVSTPIVFRHCCKRPNQHAS